MKWSRTLPISVAVLAAAALSHDVKARSDGWLKPGHPHRLSDLEAKRQ